MASLTSRLMDSKRRIVHIITGLSRGGAESVQYRLINATRDSWDATVISLGDEGFYGAALRAAGVGVLCCRMHEAGQAIPGFLRLLRFVRGSRPDVVQTWMYHADLLGGLAARLLGFRAVLWGIRSLYSGRVSWSARTASRLCAWVSGSVPAVIVSVSAQAAEEHSRRGYASEKMRVIPNGYDCRQLRPDRPSGSALRSVWGVAPDELLVGMVARWDPLKDHANLLAALKPLMAEESRLRCVLVGPGMQTGNAELSELLERHALRSRIVLAGARDDMSAVMNALDLHVLSSSSEAFPNVVAEAMACGTPCVVTDVGEAAAIVGGHGWCVPPGDSPALCAAIRSALAVLRGAHAPSLRAACRARIVQEFSEENMAAAYAAAWSDAMATRAALIARAQRGRL